MIAWAQLRLSSVTGPSILSLFRCFSSTCGKLQGQGQIHVCHPGGPHPSQMSWQLAVSLNVEWADSSSISNSSNSSPTRARSLILFQTVAGSHFRCTIASANTTRLAQRHLQSWRLICGWRGLSFWWQYTNSDIGLMKGRYSQRQQS